MNPMVRANPARFLRQDIVDKVLLKDLPSLYGIGDTQELNRFFNVLAFNTGNELGLETLSSHSGIVKSKLADYLEHLEAAYLIRRVHRIDDNALRMQRARTFKVYLTNPAIRAALFGMTGADDEAMGTLNRTPFGGRHEARRALSTDGRFGRLRRTGTGRRWVRVQLCPVCKGPRVRRYRRPSDGRSR